MRKKHDYEALLKYMRMLKAGYSVHGIANQYGIHYKRLHYLWILYQQQGSRVLHRKPYTRTSGELKQQIVKDIEKNHLSLVQASIKYGVCTSRLSMLLKIYREQGADALMLTKKRRRLKKDMGRPRKKRPEEMTELERLQERVRHLEIENTLLKKVKALVEEREARLRAIGRGQSEN